MERKFVENAEFDVRIRTQASMMQEAQQALNKLKIKIGKLKAWRIDTDIHMHKFLPL